MLFNSYAFLFGFLPASLALYYLAALCLRGARGRSAALAGLIGASLVFYGYWRPANVLIVAPSILLNYAIVRLLLAQGTRRPALASAAFRFGIAFNLCFLGYFKYRNFGLTIAHDVAGTKLLLTHLILPLGLSFITFQKIALLMDVRSGRVTEVRLRDYALFVLFFPQLVAGPIVHFRELMPQFRATDCRPRAEDFAVGLTLLSVGLFKKVVLADGIAPLVSPTFTGGGHAALFQAWLAAIGYTLQLYFDFSGYSDMAIGIARLFGMKLPYNFNSPLRAASLIEFWQRWHVTLTRFLTAYLYNPVVLALSRRRLDRGLPVMAGKHTRPDTFVALLAYPTMLTMLLSGLWHGAGYQFIAWGGLHGLALVVNHGWRLVRPRLWPDTAAYERAMRPLGVLLTLLFVVTAGTLFRAPDLGTAFTLQGGLLGLHGVTLPASIHHALQPLLHAGGLDIAASQDGGAAAFLALCVWVAAGLAIVLALPNALELLAAYEPALGFRAAAPARAGRPARWHAPHWRPSLGWAAVAAAAASLSVLSLGRLSEFIYWQF